VFRISTRDTWHCTAFQSTRFAVRESVRSLLTLAAVVAVTSLTHTTSAEQLTTHFAASRAAAARGTSAARAEAAALDEMLRGASGAERRWMQRPTLIVITSVLRFEGGVRPLYSATADRLSSTEVDEMVADLTAGLRILTGAAFEDFAAIRVEQATPEDSVRVMREGSIVAARFDGVRKALDAVGYGGRTARRDGTISSGTVILDSEYDRNDRFRRLLRIHELGHALGYNHVTSQRSIMNPTLGSEPTEFDKRVALIAFGH
jgi:hypothetical protein